MTDPLAEALRDAIADALTDDEVPYAERPRPAQVRAALRECGVYLVTVESLAKALGRYDVNRGPDTIRPAQAAAILAALGDEA